jgi:hypothetical protein
MSAIIWPVVPALDDDNECGAAVEMIGKGKGSTRRKPAPVPICVVADTRSNVSLLIIH